MDQNLAMHWETVYNTKQPHEVSWTQDVPQTSLDLIHSFNLPKDAAIIDIGGGDSKLVDCLISEGYTNITVLDISAKALERAKTRLGAKADSVTWVVADVTSFQPTTSYALWHDRAAFHFLTSEDQIASYKTLVKDFVTDHMVIGTFSDKGPLKCSGLEIKQYNRQLLEETFSEDFDLLQHRTEDHTTPFGTQQNFLFCTFEKRVSMQE